MKKINFLMLFALVFLLFGCREELDYLNDGNANQNSYQLNKDNVKTQILQKADYQSKSFLKPNVELVQTFLQQHNGSASGSLSKNSETEKPEIYTDVFEEVSYLNARYYSFYITEISPEGFEKKLILKYVDNQLAGKYILKYKRLNDFKIDPYSYQLEKLVQSSNDNENSLIINTISLSVGCTNYTITTFDCGYEDHHSNGEKCTTTRIIMPYDVVSSVYTANCQPGTSGGGLGSGDGSGGSPSNGGSTVGGGFDNTPTPEIITIPTSAPLYIIQRPKGVICNTLNLNTEEINQLNSNYNVRLRIYQYLALSGINPQLCDGILTPEAEDFVKAALQYFKNHPNATWQDYYNEFLATPCEKIKNLVNKPQIKDSLNSLKTYAQNSVKKTERGFQELKSGTLQAGNVTADNQMFFGIGPNSLGTVHTHQPKTIGILAPQDIMTFLAIVREQSSSELGNAYSGTVSSIGTYFINFTGTTSDLPPAMTETEEQAYVTKLVEIYKSWEDFLSQDSNYSTNNLKVNTPQGLEVLLFKLLKQMNLDNKIKLIKEDGGNTSTIMQNSDGTTTPNPC